MPPTQSTPRRIAFSSRSSSPSRVKMPSWGNAVTWIVQRSASSSRTRSSPRTIASFSPETSACARMKSVPCAADQRTISDARSKTSSSVSDGLSSPHTWMPSISVPLSLKRGRPTVSDASRWRWQSTSGGVTSRPSASIVSRGSPPETKRPPSTCRSTSDPSIRRQFARRRSIMCASLTSCELALDADVRPHRLEPPLAERGEELLPDREAFVVSADDLRTARPTLREHVRFVDAEDAAVAHAPFAADHDRAHCERRRAERQLLQRIVERREDERLEVEQDGVRPAPHLEGTEPVTVAGRSGSTRGRDRPGFGRAEPLLVVDLPQLVQERRRLERREHVVAVVRAHPVGPERDVHAVSQQLGHRRDARAELHVRHRVVHDRDAAIAHELDVGLRQPDAVFEAHAR